MTSTAPDTLDNFVRASRMERLTRLIDQSRLTQNHIESLAAMIDSTIENYPDNSLPDGLAYNFAILSMVKRTINRMVVDLVAVQSVNRSFSQLSDEYSENGNRNPNTKVEVS